MATIETRLLALEARHAPVAAWPELIVLRDGETMTPHQLSECERAAKFNLPHLTVIIRGVHHGE
jgi:hypothetical protein